MNTTVMLLALGVGLGIFVAFLGFARNAANSASTADIVAQRLQVYGGEKPLTMDEIELQRPFSERALRPMIERLGALLSRSTPEVARKNLQNQLDLAGRPGNLTPEDFGAVRIVAAAVMAGTGIGKILRIQADEMRRKRRQRAQELGAQATLKMMLPMVGCIFPTLWIVLLGPAALILLAPR